MGEPRFYGAGGSRTFIVSPPLVNLQRTSWPLNPRAVFGGSAVPPWSASTGLLGSSASTKAFGLDLSSSLCYKCSTDSNLGVSRSRCPHHVHEVRMRRLLMWLVTFCAMLAMLSTGAAVSAPSALAAYRRYLPAVLSRYSPPQPCIPTYGDYDYLLQIDQQDNEWREAFPVAGDVNGDGFADIVVARLKFETSATYPLDVLLNDGRGGLILATSSIFSGPVPAVQHPSEVLLADFNGDGRTDIFIADSGMDSHPFPGYQNILVFGTGDGKLVDASYNLPQQKDISHSACTADIDGDGDLDIYVGNVWGQNMIWPQLLLNDGQGKFTVGTNRLPELLSLNHNGYTVCEFADLNNDGSPDLVVGDEGDTIENQLSTRTSEVLLNDGTGAFTRRAGALPPKDSDPTDKCNDIDAIHLNGDAYLDLLVAYQGKPSGVSYLQALINNGDGTFRSETDTRLGPVAQQRARGWLSTCGTPREVIDVRDVDRDGDFDLLAKPWNNLDADPLLLLNDGQGYFSWGTLASSLHAEFGADLWYTFIDLERDGGLDLLLTLSYPPDMVFAVRQVGCALQ
jgi:hypothetical protein